MANSTLEPAKAAEPRATKPSLAKALQSIFSKSEEPDESKAIAKRRRFVMAAVLGTLSVNLLMFLRFFFPRALYEPKTKFKIGYPSDFGFGVDTKFQNQHRIWVVRNTEGIFVIICRLHAPGLHTGLETQREQVQVPVSRQRLRPRRHQLRGSGAAAHGSRPRGTRPGRADCRRREPRLFVAQGRTFPVRRPWRHSARVRSDICLKATDTTQNLYPQVEPTARRGTGAATAARSPR